MDSAEMLEPYSMLLEGLLGFDGFPLISQVFTNKQIIIAELLGQCAHTQKRKSSYSGFFVVSYRLL